MINEDIYKIIAAGVSAPSGENCQPWRFVKTGDHLALYNLPDRDKSLYNWNQYGSLMAHGACIENISIAAAVYGYATTASLFPMAEDDNCVATIKFEKSAPAHPEIVSLYKKISERVTNRKSYRDEKLSLDIENELAGFGDARIRLHIESSAENRVKIADAVSVGDRVLFENKQLHDFFFAHILWTPEEEKLRKFGFYIKTLELPPNAEKGFPIMKHWIPALILKFLGVTKKIAQDNAKLYASGSATIAILSPKITKEVYVNAGRIMQRLWLSATKNALSVQPMTAVSFFHRRIAEGDERSFSPQHTEMIEGAYRQLQKLYKTSDEIIVLVRVGYADNPSAQTSRFAARSFITELWQ